ncbi:MAG: hypothetical protein JXB15_01430 [Anaerolineales bacterium]|nr:hypothetical protein [Anaerolineales bacterium]
MSSDFDSLESPYLPGLQSTPAEPAPIPDAPPELAPLIEQATLARAHHLARSGQYQQAEGLLETLPDIESRPAALDLLARMRAQQGRLAEAEALWSKALALEPANPAYLEGLQYVTRQQKPVRLGFLSGRAWLWLLALVGLALLGLSLSRLGEVQGRLASLSDELAAVQTSAARPLPTALVIAASPYPTLPPGLSSADLELMQQAVLGEVRLNQATQDALFDQVLAIQNSQGELLTSLQETPVPPLDLAIQMPGIRVLQENRRVTLTFEGGLFAYGWTLKPESRALLTRLGQALEPYTARIQVTLTGCQADDEAESYLDLGLLRALAVYDHLRATTQLPASLFTLHPQADEPAPYPNDSTANRLRNRTVVIVISAHP